MSLRLRIFRDIPREAIENAKPKQKRRRREGGGGQRNGVTLGKSKKIKLFSRSTAFS